VVALTDRCAGYAKCSGSGYQEAGPCVNDPTLSPQCACVGPVPGVFAECCGRGCPGQTGGVANCDWCAATNHPHFDLDDAAFAFVCGSQAGLGSCQLSGVKYTKCMDPNPAWPPGGGTCAPGTFACTTSPDPANQPQIPGTKCCCNWGKKPQADGTCA
jgi:hypothetical protein